MLKYYFGYIELKQIYYEHSFHCFFTLLDVAIRKLKITGVVPTCGSHISAGQRDGELASRIESPFSCLAFQDRKGKQE